LGFSRIGGFEAERAVGLLGAEEKSNCWMIESTELKRGTLNLYSLATSLLYRSAQFSSLLLSHKEALPQQQGVVRHQGYSENSVIHARQAA
jgi:hypothetical protein